MGSLKPASRMFIKFISKGLPGSEHVTAISVLGEAGTQRALTGPIRPCSPESFSDPESLLNAGWLMRFDEQRLTEAKEMGDFSGEVFPADPGGAREAGAG